MSPARSKGIAALVTFWVLFFWEVWAYMVVITKPPGFARDVEEVVQCDPPTPPAAKPYSPPPNMTNTDDPIPGNRAPILNSESQPGDTTTLSALVPSSPPEPIRILAPPSFPVLHPAHRYCSRDGFVKPFRAHHCSMCGTVCVAHSA